MIVDHDDAHRATSASQVLDGLLGAGEATPRDRPRPRPAVRHRRGTRPRLSGDHMAIAEVVNQAHSTGADVGVLAGRRSNPQCS